MQKKILGASLLAFAVTSMVAWAQRADHATVRPDKLKWIALAAYAKGAELAVLHGGTTTLAQLCARFGRSSAG